MLNNIKKIFNSNPDIKKVLFVSAVIIFIYLTVPAMLTHIPWRDEAIVWNVAKHLSFTQILNIMNWQGHMFLWYLIIKPFAMNDFCYPYSMLIINWLFVFSAILLMWRYAKFNPLLKFFITFSYPMLNLYPIVAREYGIGILLLFLLASMFKRRLEHPYIYTTIIFFAANIGAITLAGVSAFGFLFMYDYLKYCAKQKSFRKLLYPVLVFILTIVMFYIQLGHPVVPEYSIVFSLWDRFKPFLFDLYGFELLHIISYVVIPLFVIFGFLLFSKKPRALFFWLCSNIELFIVFNIYDCKDYHFYFIFIYTILAYWLYMDEQEANGSLRNKIFCVVFSLLSLMYVFKLPQALEPFLSPAKSVVFAMKKYIPNVDNAIVYSSSTFDMKVIAPYFPKTKFLYYDGTDMYSFEHFKECWYPMIENYNFDDYSDRLESGYVLIRHNIEYIKKLKTKKVHLTPIYSDKQIYIGKLDINDKK